jgi:phosphoribosylformylglycinamidine synthase
VTKVKAIVLRAAGINCDMETEYALQLAGAEAERVQGKILANQIIHHIYEPIQKFINEGKLVLGICNGFQVLVKTGILPGNEESQTNSVTITYNDSGKYEDRWVYLTPKTDKCIFIKPGRQIYRPRKLTSAFSSSRADKYICPSHTPRAKSLQKMVQPWRN